MTKNKTFVSNIILTIIILLSVVIVNNAAFYVTPLREFNIIELSIFCFVLLALIFAFTLINQKQYHRLIYLIITFILIFIVFSVYELIRPTINNYLITTTDQITFSMSFELTILSRVKSILFLFVGITYFFFTFIILPKTNSYQKFFKVALIVYLVVVVLSIIYSLCFEFSKYQAFFSDLSFNYRYATSSFLRHRNIFALFLLIGIFVAMLLDSYQERIIYKAAMFLFWLFIFATVSKMNIILSTLAMVIYFTRLLIRGIRKKPLITVVIISIIFLLGITAFVFIQMYQKQTSVLELFASLKSNIFESLSESMEIRKEIWQTSLALFNGPLVLLFGNGLYLYTAVLSRGLDTLGGPYASLETTHNGYLDLFGQYGIIGCGLIIALFVFLIIKAIKLKNVKRNTLFVCLLALGIFSFSAMFESFSLFAISDKGLIVFFITFLPLVGFKEKTAKNIIA